jgi:hypothetical protein
MGGMTTRGDLALIGGYVVPVTGPPIPAGTVLIRDGDIAVWSGDPLDVTSRAERVYITGSEVYRYDAGPVVRERFPRG